MSRPLRLEFAGSFYRVTARGDRREAIFEDNADREELPGVLAQALARFDPGCLACCLMPNHCHLVIETRRANLSRLMRQVTDCGYGEGTPRGGLHAKRRCARRGAVGPTASRIIAAHEARNKT